MKFWHRVPGMKFICRQKNIRELMLARAVATSVVAPREEAAETDSENTHTFSEDEILKDWFEANE